MIELSRANAFSHQTMNTLKGDHISSRVFVIYIYINIMNLNNCVVTQRNGNGSDHFLIYFCLLDFHFQRKQTKMEN